MLLSNFWLANQKEIIISSIFILISICLLVVLSFIQTKYKQDKKNIFIGLILIILIISGVTYSLIQYGISAEKNVIGKIVLVDSIIVAVYGAICYMSLKNIHDNKKKTKFSTSKIAFLGIITGLSSVLMLFSVPIFPAAPYLKLELSALVIFMIFIWFDFKSAVIVSLLTNIIHGFMPSTTPPLIPFLDELVNFIATMAFLLPTVVFFNKDHESNSNRIIFTTLLGILFTTVFMVLFNAYINLPIVYELNMKFAYVLKIFGLFNVLKWGVVALAINLLWQRLYNIKDALNLSIN